MSFFRKRVFYNNAPSQKRESKSVKCRGVYLRTEQNGWYVIRQNNIKQKTIYLLCVDYFLAK